MVSRAKLVKTALLMVELTSLPLMVLVMIYLLSGYQMLDPEVKIIPEARKIHADWLLRLISMTLVYVHTLGGGIFIVERHIKKVTQRKIIEAVIAILVTMLLIIILALEVRL